MRAIASLTSLIELRLQHFDGVTDAGVLTLSSLTALKSLDLTVPQRYTRSDYDAAAAARIGLALAVLCSERVSETACIIMAWQRWTSQLQLSGALDLQVSGCVPAACVVID